MFFKKMKGEHMCHCKMWMMKLAFASFVLFLITVWPAAMRLVHSIHWGWFLGASILFCLMAMKHMWMHGKGKRRR